MKILHSSDWHLGHRFHEQLQHEEQTCFLQWLIQYIVTHRVQLLLVSGDVFDVGVPSAQAQKMYYDFLVQLHQQSDCHLILTGGNHDAPSTLNAPSELLKALSIHVVGKATDNPDDEVIRVQAGGDEVIVAAIPYLRDQDIRRAVAAESAEEIQNRYKTALIRHFAEVAQRAEALRTGSTPLIAMGHLFAIDGTSSESEQSIYVGNLGDIGAADFPDSLDYIALGHLHRAQMVDQKAHIRYSGSPYPLSFSEAGMEKKIILIDSKKPLHIEEISVPCFRPIVRLKGSVEACKTQLQALHDEPHTLTPWVEIILTEKEEAALGYRDIHEFATPLRPLVLKISICDEDKYENLKSLVDNGKQVKHFTPLEVFRLRCEELHIDLEHNADILDAFNEIVHLVTEKE